MVTSSVREPSVKASHIPRDYVHVLRGNAYITRHCRKLTHESKQTVYIVEDAHDYASGIAVPRQIHARVQQLDAETSATRAAAVVRKDLSLETKFHNEVLRLFPKIEEKRIKRITKIQLKKRSGCAGRSKELTLVDMVNLGVRAHIRHTCTDYDVLLNDGMERHEARKIVQPVIEQKVKDWGGLSKFQIVRYPKSEKARIDKPKHHRQSRKDKKGRGLSS